MRYKIYREYDLWEHNHTQFQELVEFLNATEESDESKDASKLSIFNKEKQFVE